jgi:prophage tail gpP-like protein
MLDGDLFLRIGDRSLSGWTSVRVTRSLEQVPNSFQIGYTATGPTGVLVREGAPVQVFIGSDLVVTGYADVVRSRSDAKSHELMIAGRGKCQDLVDCSAQPVDAQGNSIATIANADITALAQMLAKPYAINVPPAPGSPPRVLALGFTLVDTPWQIIEEVARFSQLLVYEDEHGDLILANVAQTAAASGFQEGVNVTSIEVTSSAADRFSVYGGFLYSAIQQLADIGPIQPIYTAIDPNVQRPRRKNLIVESARDAINPTITVGQRRVIWEAARRAGRAKQAVVTVPGWRDAAGTLWAPNTIAPLDLPSHGITRAQWVIGDVTFIRDAEGTRSEVMLMAPQAFQPEPLNLYGATTDIQDAAAQVASDAAAKG